MGHVYTPGLKVTEYTKVKKRRILPLKGEVTVKVGDKVDPHDVVARTELPGNVDSINATNILGCDPDDLNYFMKVELNQPLVKGDIIAQNKGIFNTGFFKTQIKMPFNGHVESMSSVTGNILLRAKPIPVEVTAYIEGEISEIIPREGVVLEANATFIQGIFGIGGERFGEIVTATSDHKTDLTADLVKEEHRNKILICGRRITSGAFAKALEMGVKGIVAGGVDDRDLKEILGEDIGVAITGSEDVSTTLIVTEGFGDIPMAERTFELLKKYENRHASINGATQIRAGVIRPEIVITQPKPPKGFTEPTETTVGLDIGSVVRIIRVPYFGHLGEVIDLPPELQELESGSKARVLKVRFKDGKETVIPRANVETIET
ncbi:hypothetical protein KAH81_06090 [bacterium]|nr:hypothetical protein [bacterium]